MITKEAIEKVRNAVLFEIETYKTPLIDHLELANSVGQRLAKKFKADKDIVILGTLLMDYKLGECKAQGKLSEHVQRSSQEASKLLDSLGIAGEEKDKIINCVEGHHGAVPFICKEAEICANADCYRFLHPLGITSWMYYFGKEFPTKKEMIAFGRMKIEEKKKILSIDACKRELKKYFKAYDAMFEQVN
jgi:HD superfamily phosphodiesterase